MGEMAATRVEETRVDEDGNPSGAVYASTTSTIASTSH